jgi:hypothetical protein
MMRSTLVVVQKCWSFESYWGIKHLQQRPSRGIWQMYSGCIGRY